MDTANPLMGIVLGATDSAGDRGTSSRAFTVIVGSPPSATLTLGKLERNRRRGMARLTVTVDRAGTLTLTGKGIKRATGKKARAGRLRLSITPKGATARRLRRSGRARVRVHVAFKPDVGTTVTKYRLVTLKRTR